MVPISPSVPGNCTVRSRKPPSISVHVFATFAGLLALCRFHGFPCFNPEQGT